ncbi:hypothetical protein ABE522_13105 [Stenotrophomonas pennii]|uniref:hypothetical protein n=1 Tax=Stenotrophomonas lacuserhaii TaxID=2760084 RepID=UPI003207FBCE
MPSSRAAQWIEALLARQQEPPILEKKTGLPYGWAIWLRARPPLPRPQHARELVAVLLPRPRPAASGRLPGLTMWQAVRRLGWQQWDPAPRDQRWMRWTAAAASLLLHVLFAFLLLWVALVRSSQPDTGGEGERVQVEFIGQGAQEGGGDQPGSEAAAAAEGGAASAATDSPAASPSAAQDGAPAASSTAAQPVPAEVAAATASEPAPAEPAPPVPAPALPTPPVQATDVAEATTDFVVPPVSVPRTEVTVVPRQASPSVREREVQVVQAPVVVTPRPVTPVRTRAPSETTVQVREREVPLAVQAPTPLRVPQAEVAVQVAPREPTVVREREVAAVTAPAITMPAMRGREPALRTRPSTEPTVRERAVANAAARAAATANPRPSATPAAQASSSSSAAAAASASTAASRAPGQAGAQARPTPGNWATPARGDDWGASTRDRPGSSAGAQANRDAGQGSGVFNADGSVRVPGQDGAGNTDRGAPGGDNDGWSRDRIAQSGTWLKRPPYDYTPTSFDKYWVPNESLLAEWVRRGVQSVEIPLPGTSTKISCVISVLQFGGGCGLNDPNMQDQPAIARPPPDVPFKKELQEDNGSVR